MGLCLSQASSLLPAKLWLDGLLPESFLGLLRASPEHTEFLAIVWCRGEHQVRTKREEAGAGLSRWV